MREELGWEVGRKELIPRLSVKRQRLGWLSALRLPLSTAGEENRCDKSHNKKPVTPSENGKLFVPSEFEERV
jgi:hypothetical protein